MIRTGDTARFDPAIRQGHAAMGATVVEQADIAALVAEQHQGLAQDAHHLGWILRRKLARHAYGQPIAAQQLARRRARPDSGQHIVFCSRQHCLAPRFTNSAYLLAALSASRFVGASSTNFNAASIIDVNISQGTAYYASPIDKKACKINKLNYVWNFNVLTIERRRNGKNGC
jgi:hypothetical protein